MEELTPLQKARKNYEERVKKDPELKAKREKQRRKSAAHSHIKFEFNLQDLYESLELTLALILLHDTTDIATLSKEDRKKFLGGSKPQALLNDEQLNLIGDITDKIRKK